MNRSLGDEQNSGGRTGGLGVGRRVGETTRGAVYWEQGQGEVAMMGTCQRVCATSTVQRGGCLYERMGFGDGLAVRMWRVQGCVLGRMLGLEKPERGRSSQVQRQP